VDRLGAALLGGADDLLDREVALGRYGRPDQVGLVALPDVGRIAIGLRVDGDRGDAHLAERPRDPYRDLAAVCDQNLLEHGRDSIRRVALPAPCHGRILAT